MKYKIKYAILNVLTAFTYNLTASNTIQKTSYLQTLISDLSEYKPTNTFHAGNLAEHSIWTANVIDQWFKINDSWCNGLNNNDKEILKTAALLHDIGKAGDLKFKYFSKPFHEYKSQQYLLSKEDYILKNGKKFDFDKLFKELNIDTETQKIISIIVGAHAEFGNTIMQNLTLKDIAFDNKPQINKCINCLLKTLILLKNDAAYKKPITKKFIKYIILLCTADVKGSQPFPRKILNNDDDDQAKNNIVSDNYSTFNYDTLGKIYRENILENLSL